MSILSRYLDPQTLNQIADATLVPRSLVQGNLAGGHKSPLAGFAIEFAGHREYVPGDDPKHIDWRVYFTRDKYFVKQYELETNFVCHLVLDVSASMRYGDDDSQKLLYAARMATALGYAVVKQNDKVSLATFDRRLRGFVPPGNTMAQIVRITEHLGSLDPIEKTSIAACLTELAGRTQRREIIFIFSDFLQQDLDEMEDALQRLRYQRHEVVLFHVLHPHERRFEFEGMVKFLGLEDADEYLTQTEDVREGYLAALREYGDRLEELAVRNQIELVAVDTGRSQGEVLLDYLHRRLQMVRSR